jgi:hypothetical protein
VSADTSGSPVASRLKRVGLGAAAALTAVNIWTGSPLLAVWVGSRVVGDSGLSMGAVFLVLFVFGASAIGLAWLLALISARYDDLTGRPHSARRTSPWLRSMRGEREQEARRRSGVSAVERVVITSVVAAVLAFEGWFFLFADGGIPSGTGG